ncbi:MAG: heavy metal translocating P-type ATPase [Gemmatimonadaceae bacterium]
MAARQVGGGSPWRRQLAIPVAVSAVLLTGAVLRIAGASDAAATVWMVGLAITGLPLAWRTTRQLLKGHFATDVVAMLAVGTAVVLHQQLAGLVIVLMQSGGEALERYAEGRASAAVRALEDDAPRIAHRVSAGANTEDIEVAAIAVGDLLLVRPGEMVPCDGTVDEGASHVDTARITGEPVPVHAAVGTSLSSGSLNIDGPLTVRATATAGASQYARIVELVRNAQASKAPLQRLADKYAVWFTPVTLIVCAIAYALSRDWDRVLAVLVVATPCPLILATPVAIIGGVNRAARAHVIIRDGGALEQLAQITVAVFDKTGTLTVGAPEVSKVIASDGIAEREVLRLVAALEHRSGHLLAGSVVRAATAAGLSIADATEVTEDPGRGVKGVVEGRRVCVGARSFANECVVPGARASAATPAAASGLRAHVVIDGHAAGTIEFADLVRPALPAFFAELRGLGVARTLLLSGDSAAHTMLIAQSLGMRDARGDLMPGDKVAVVKQLIGEGERVLMVGDGTNDAPALSAAHVGIALAGHGGGITAEAADVVILGDDVTRVAEVIRISRRTLRIARQSIRVGLGLSGVAMLIAAAGFIPPIVGAIIQEAIDVAVILNALRSSR